MRISLEKKLPGGLKLAMLLAFMQPVAIFAQTYNFNAPVMGYWKSGAPGFQEIAFSDYSNPHTWPQTGRAPGFSENLTFGMLNGTLLYDPTANTMRMFGNVGVNTGTISGSFDDSQTINGVLVPATVSVTCSIANVHNGVLSFDTGVVQHPTYYNGWPLDIPMSLNVTYSLVTGGETYNGSYSSTLNIPVNFQIESNSASSLTFLTDTIGGSDDGATGLVHVTADNGVQMYLDSKDPNDGSTYVQWHVDDATAYLQVPETMNLALPACVLLALGIGHRRLVN